MRQVNPEKRELALYGLDLAEGVLRDNIAAGVLEPALGKIKVIQARLRSFAACVLELIC